jgi:hypothetical protein
MAKNKHINDAITPSDKIIAATVSRVVVAELFLKSFSRIGESYFGFNIKNTPH